MPRPVPAQLAILFAAVLATALATAVAGPAWAQSTDPNLFRLGQPGEMTAPRDDPAAFSPTIDGRPSRFQRAVPGRPVIGRPQVADVSSPVEPIPPASGAGVSGFDSTNGSRKRPRRTRPDGTPDPAAKPLAQAAPLVKPAVLPGVFATRPSRSDRHGVGGTLPPDPKALPQRKRVPAPEADAYEQLGIRAGAFTLFPSLELTGGYDTNPSHGPGYGGSTLGIVAPELHVRSDWQRHSLTADMRGTYSTYAGHFVPALDRPALDARVNGRIDTTKLSSIDLQGRLIVGTDTPGSPNIQAGVSKLTIFTTLGGTMGYTQRFNRFELAAKGTLDRTVYQDSTFTDGSTANNDDRNFNQYGGALRGSYEVSPGLKPFVEISADTRDHDLAIDRTGLRRDSTGTAGKLGTTFEFTRKLTGEASAGYLNRTYKDPALQDLSGPTFDAALIFAATPLTTFTGTARSTADEVIVPGVSGVLRRDLTIQADHAFRRWLIATAKIGVGYDDYVGISRKDQRYLASMAVTYKLSRDLQLKGEIRRDWLHSNVANVDYGANSYLIGLKLLR